MHSLLRSGLIPVHHAFAHQVKALPKLLSAHYQSKVERYHRILELKSCLPYHACWQLSLQAMQLDSAPNFHSVRYVMRVSDHIQSSPLPSLHAHRKIAATSGFDVPDHHTITKHLLLANLCTVSLILADALIQPLLRLQKRISHSLTVKFRKLSLHPAQW